MADSTNVSLSVALLTTAASGIIGVAVAEAFAYLREKRRADVEAAQKEMERQHELRRDVYLKAATATVRIMAAMGRLSDPVVSHKEADRASEEFNAAMTKVYIVAKPGTIRRASDLQRAVTGLYLELITERVPLLRRQYAIDLAKRNADAHQNNFDRFLEMMRMLNIQGPRDEPRFAAVEQQANLANQNMLDEARNLERLLEEQRKDQRKLLEGMVPRLIILAEIQVDALVAIRSDLGVDDAVDVLRQELVTNFEALRASMKKLFPNKSDAGDEDSTGT